MMIARKDRNYIKSLIIKTIREELVKQLNKSSFKTAYKPTDDNNDNGGNS